METACLCKAMISLTGRKVVRWSRENVLQSSLAWLWAHYGDPRSKSGVHSSCVALSVSRDWEDSIPTHPVTQRESFAPLIQA